MWNPFVEGFADALTLRRIRAHALVIALALWSTLIWNYSTPGLLDRNGLLKGTDFLHFYTIGTLVHEGRTDQLYDLTAQVKLAEERVPEARGLVYAPFYGPQVALLFSPLAALSYRNALIIWMVFNVILYVSCCWLAWRQCPVLRTAPGTVALCAVSFPPFFHLLIWGQTSGLALLCFTFMFLALHRGKKFVAGLAFGLLFFKPQLGIAGFVIFLLAAEWRLLAGAAITAAAQLGVAWLYFGGAVLGDYLRHLYAVPERIQLLEPKLYQLHSLRGFWELLMPTPGIAGGLYVISAVIVLALAFRTWQRTETLDLRFSALLFATVLIAPHLTIYDLVILAPGFLLLANWALRHSAPEVRDLLYWCFVLPLAGPLAKWTHVQITVIAMSALVYVLETYCRTTNDVDALQTKS